MTENEKVVANERFRDACVAFFEHSESPLPTGFFEYAAGHPYGCKCDPCVAMQERNATRSAERAAKAVAIRDAARAARKALA